MRALVTVASRQQFEFEGRTVTHLDELGKPKHQMTVRGDLPVLKPGTHLVYGLEDGTIASHGVITGVLVRR